MKLIHTSQFLNKLKFMTRYILVLLILFSPIKNYSQTIASPFTATENNLKSPQVHLLKQFADNPVDLSINIKLL